MTKKRSKQKKFNRTTIQQTPSTSFSAAVSMFSNSQNTRISGGSFNNTINVNTGPSLDVLHKRVAPNAILNAGGRADEVRCHPGTREEVIDHIEKWGDTEDNSAAPIFWLSGPAGAGKSAIMQTVAERCEERGVPQANFFFFRADTSRSNAPPLIPTLLHQLILVYPSLRDPVAALLFDNPLIFDSTLESQLTQLIVTPLNSVQQSSRCPLIFLIDGLDECNSETKQSQQKILRAFDTVLEHHPQHCPFRLLIASRDESQIRAAFNKMSSQCRHLYLDDQYSPETDIRRFVNDKFEELKKSHPLASTLPTTWPSAIDIDYIVEKSSGQFIHAATVMRFIADASASPKVSLERVKGAARLATKSPFAHLDAIYTYILAQVDDQEAVKDILHAQLLIQRLSTFKEGIYSIQPDCMMSLLELLRLYNPQYTEEIIVSCFADLTPIARYLPDVHELVFYHASFSDYLLDQSRSASYFVDVVKFNCKISPMAWEQIQHDRGHSELSLEHVAVLTLLELQTFPPGMLGMLRATRAGWRQIKGNPEPPIFNMIHKQCVTDDDIKNLKWIIQEWLDSFSTHAHIRSKYIPFAHRYIQMGYAKSFRAPDDEMRTALRPETESDCHELKVWLDNLLRSIHEHIYADDPERYHQLLKAWISWAKENGIPCHGLEDLPDAQEYI